MTEIEKKALALLNEGYESNPWANVSDASHAALIAALRRAIEQHEQFKREVSDKIETLLEWPSIRSQAIIASNLSPFILPKPVDPLVEALCEMDPDTMPNKADADNLRAALAARGLKIVEVGHD